MPDFGSTPRERIVWSITEYQADRIDLATLMGNLNSQIGELTDEPWLNPFWDLCMSIEETYSMHIFAVDPAGRPGGAVELDYEGAVLIEQAIERILDLVKNASPED